MATSLQYVSSRRYDSSLSTGKIGPRSRTPQPSRRIILGHRSFVATCGRPLGIARAPTIGLDHRAAPGQLGHDAVPLEPGRSKAVEPHAHCRRSCDGGSPVGLPSRGRFHRAGSEQSQPVSWSRWPGPGFLPFLSPGRPDPIDAATSAGDARGPGSWFEKVLVPARPIISPPRDGRTRKRWF